MNLLFSNLKNLPKRTIRLGIFSMLASGLLVLSDYGMAQMLQLYTVLLGFIDKSQAPKAFIFLLDSDKTLLIILIGVILFRGGCQFLLNFLNVAFAESFIYDTRNKYLQIVYLGDKNVNLGSAATVLGDIIPKAANYVTQVVRYIVLLVQVLGIGLICLYSLPKEFLTTILIFSLILPIMMILNRRSRLFAKVILNESEKLNHHLMTSIKNLLFLKILSNEKKELDQSKKHTQKYYQTFMKNNVLSSFSNSVPNTFGLSIVFLLFYFFHSKGSSSAELLGFFYLLNRFIQSAAQLVSATNGISVNETYFADLIKILTAPELEQKNLLPGNYSLKQFSPEEGLQLQVSKISVKYDQKIIFEDISLNLNEKELLLIKGESGSGKSTFLMTLIGLLSPSKGEVAWNNVKLQDLSIESIKKHIGYLGAEPYIVSGTIKENLLYGVATEPNNNKIFECLKLAKAKEFVDNSPNGLDSLISEQGAGLSMGQKQRIGLARALLRSPTILILDEITANLDKETETHVVQNIKSLKENMTIIIATHSNAFDNIADKVINF